MYGNPICVQIPWDKNAEALAKWANGKTGFPWIDAIMTQLREEGWIHHLARHAIACFLTRGDLWQSWEDGITLVLNGDLVSARNVMDALNYEVIEFTDDSQPESQSYIIVKEKATKEPKVLQERLRSVRRPFRRGQPAASPARFCVYMAR